MHFGLILFPLVTVNVGLVLWLFRAHRPRWADPSSNHQSAAAAPAGLPYSYAGYVVISYKRGSPQKNGNSNEADWLYDKLKPEPGCTPFQDIQNLIKGEQFKPQLLAACQTCSVFVPLLSKGYVRSRFCLQELQWASEAADPQPAIVPVLLDDPTVLQRQCLPRYRGVLKAALKLESVVVPPSGLEPGCANSFVAAVRAHLRPVLKAEGIAQAEEWSRQVLTQLEANRVVVLHGLGGSGKTTLAKLTYQQLLSRKQLGGRVCLVQVGKDCSEDQLRKQQQHMLAALRKLTDPPEICSSEIGASLLAEAAAYLAKKPFAVILDDVWHPDVCKALLPNSLRNCSNGWVLVTTRNENMLPGAAIMQQPVLCPEAEWEVLQYNAGYTLDGLPPTDRQLLLELGAKLPLKLELLGRQFSIAPPGSLGGEAVLRGLRKRISPAEVAHGLDVVFLKSYESLPSLQLKLAFLDIGMFMRGQPKWLVSEWCMGIHGELAEDLVLALAQRALVTWTGSSNDPVNMHDALREFVGSYVEKSRGGPTTRPEENTFFWEKPLEVARWPPGSHSITPQRLVAFDCPVACTLLASLPGNSGYPLHLQPQLDSLVVLVLRNTDWYPDPGYSLERQLRLQDLPNLRLLDLWDCDIEVLQLQNLPCLRVLLLGGDINELDHWVDWSDAIGAMRQLQHVQAASCKMKGVLPSKWSGLENLRHLDLANNKLEGPLPSSWSVLGNLRHLNLAYIELQGPLPWTWSVLKNLTYLCLSDNNLQGPLPVEWGALTALRELHLSRNVLTGPLPEEWEELASLQNLELSGNCLCGHLPRSWSKLCSLQELRLYTNDLSGKLPPQWSALQKLEVLHMFKNKLQGKLPPSWSALFRLKEFSLWRNSLCGPLPVSWSQLQQLEVLDLSECSLEGPIPEQWAALPRLRVLHLHDNRLAGVVPGWVRRAADADRLEVRLADNQFDWDDWLNSREYY